MLNKGAKGQLAEGVEQEAELYRSLTASGNNSHTTALLYGGGPALTNSAGVPWTAAYIDTIGGPTADLRSNIILPPEWQDEAGTDVGHLENIAGDDERMCGMSPTLVSERLLRRAVRAGRTRLTCA
jgi:hypothetical protein